MKAVRPIEWVGDDLGWHMATGVAVVGSEEQDDRLEV
jgi:hypothetical protein